MYKITTTKRGGGGRDGNEARLCKSTWQTSCVQRMSEKSSQISLELNTNNAIMYKCLLN